METAGRKNSFIRTIAIAVYGYIALMVIILSAVWINTASTLESTARGTILQAKELSGYEIGEVLKSNEQALASVLQNNDNIVMIERGNEVQRATATQNMLQNLKNAELTSDDVETIFFYDLLGDAFLAGLSPNRTYNESVAIEAKVRELNEVYPDNMPSIWFCEEIDGSNYLLRLYKNKKRILGAAVSLQDYAKDAIGNDVLSYTITDSNYRIAVQWGSEGISEEYLGEDFVNKTGWSKGKQFYITGRDFQKGDFLLFVSIARSQVYGAFQILQMIILILIFSAIVLLLSIAFYTRKVVYAPLKDLLDAMKAIENGDQSKRLPGEAYTEEFSRINSSFNQMVDTIMNLRMRSYEERIQFDEATLKYVQLQIRPHFFLNALTTIHSMSLQDRGEDIREYIERLSRNVRYLFKSGLHTVPLSEEVEHARDYIAMQEVLYPGCIFDFIEIDESLNDYPVPQLIIHTILENIYKHAVSVDSLTSILITAKPEEKGGEEMCHIVVEDDGPGFPEEFLQEVRSGDIKVREDGHGVGLWNLKKTLSLMYRKDDLIEFSNKEPHGSRVDMWIPKRVKRQSSVWKQS